MMTDQIDMSITRRAGLNALVVEPLRVNHSERLFRPDHLREELFFVNGTWHYEVIFTGASLTASGKSHASNRSKAHYREPLPGSVGGRMIADLPAALQALLLGKDALIAQAVSVLAQPGAMVP